LLKIINHLKGIDMASNVVCDAILVSKYIKGDESALALLIERHQSKIYGFIYSKVSDRDISDDIFQDTFMKVIRILKTKSYNGDRKLLQLVIRTAHLLIDDQYRHNKKMSM